MFAGSLDSCEIILSYVATYDRQFPSVFSHLVHSPSINKYSPSINKFDCTVDTPSVKFVSKVIRGVDPGGGARGTRVSFRPPPNNLEYYSQFLPYRNITTR